MSTADVAMVLAEGRRQAWVSSGGAFAWFWGSVATCAALEYADGLLPVWDSLRGRLAIDPSAVCLG